MAKTKTSFNEGNQPSKRRGKSKRTIILEAVREKALLSVDSEASIEDVEKAVFGFMAESAFNPTEETASISSACLTHLMNKGWASIKPAMEPVNFTLRDNSTPIEKVNQILYASASGEIPPDVAKIFIDAIKAGLDIEQATEIKERIEAIEKALANESNCTEQARICYRVSNKSRLRR